MVIDYKEVLNEKITEGGKKYDLWRSKHAKLLDAASIACKLSDFFQTQIQDSTSEKERLITTFSTIEITRIESTEKIIKCQPMNGLSLGGCVLLDNAGTTEQIQYLLDFKSILQAQYGMRQLAILRISSSSDLGISHKVVNVAGSSLSCISYESYNLTK